jgi:hypothetical protein
MFFRPKRLPSLLRDTNYSFTGEFPDDYLARLPEYVQKYGPITNTKEEFRYFGFRYTDFLRSLRLPVLSLHLEKEALLIEFRPLPHLEFLVRNCILKLGSSWSYTILCGKQNAQLVQNLVRCIGRSIRVIVSEVDNLTAEQYNFVLTQSSFWSSLEGHKILIYQEDTCIFQSLDDFFLSFDYIGAPYPLSTNYGVNHMGNGGLSLRTRQVMLEVIRRQPYLSTINNLLSLYGSDTLEYMNRVGHRYPPEDMYFVKSIEKLRVGTLADWNSAFLFSSESILNPSSFGAHGVWLQGNQGRHRPLDPGLWRRMMFTYIVPRLQLFSRASPTYHRGGWTSVMQCIRERFEEGTKDRCPSSAIAFHDVCEETFLWDSGPQGSILTRPWIGMVHVTPLYLPNASIPPCHSGVDLARFFREGDDVCTRFRESLPTCLALLTTTETNAMYLRTQLAVMNASFVPPIHVLRHPVESKGVIPFEMYRFQRNYDKKIIQLGLQIRKVSSLYRLPTIEGYSKLWLTGCPDFDRCRSYLEEEETFHGFTITPEQHRQVDMRYIESYRDYDLLLAQNIVFMDLYDSAANNAVLECLLRNTPLIINRTAGVVEYLGESYPLYFYSLEEVPFLLSDPHKLFQAHVYLQQRNKTILTIDAFQSEFTQVIYDCTARQRKIPFEVPLEEDWNS